MNVDPTNLILRALAHAEQPLTVRELVAATGLSESTVYTHTRLLGPLRRSEPWLRPYGRGATRRGAVAWGLTPKGVEIAGYRDCLPRDRTPSYVRAS